MKRFISFCIIALLVYRGVLKLMKKRYKSAAGDKAVAVDKPGVSEPLIRDNSAVNDENNNKGGPSGE